MLMSSLTFAQDSNPKLGFFWLHGLGASGSDLLPVAKKMTDNLHESCQNFFFQAPMQAVALCQNQVVPAWYNLFGIDLQAREDQQGIATMTNLLVAEIEQIQSQHSGITHWFIAGFSQGAAMANYIARNRALNLSGLIMFSGYWPLAKLISRQKKIAFFASHGQLDSVIPATALDHIAQLASLLDWQGHYCWDQSASHEISEYMLASLQIWLTENFL